MTNNKKGSVFVIMTWPITIGILSHVKSNKTSCLLFNI